MGPELEKDGYTSQPLSTLPPQSRRINPDTEQPTSPTEMDNFDNESEDSSGNDNPSTASAPVLNPDLSERGPNQRSY